LQFTVQKKLTLYGAKIIKAPYKLLSMATVNFMYRSNKPMANLTIRLLFRHKGKDFVFSAKTKNIIEADYWNNDHNKTRILDAKLQNKQSELKAELLEIENHILKNFELADKDRMPKGWLQSQIDFYYNPKVQTTISNRLVEYIDYYIECKKVDLSSSSLMKYTTIQSKLIKLEASLKKTIFIENIDESFKNEFVKYYKENKYNQNTIQRELAFVKTFCRHARNNGIETSIQLDGLLLQKAKVEKVYLTFEELEKIESIQLEDEALENARNWLIISCFTGQRVSDFLNFKSDMIRIEDGIQLIEFTQKKTGKIMSLALHPKVIQILNKNNGAFPYKISDQRYNEHIKTVCRLAGLKSIVKGGKVDPDTNRKVYDSYPKYELVTSHIGRRSFATNFYGKIPTSLLINATGHSTESMFLEYIGKSQTQQAKELAKFW
jgi:hypothetical protein